MSMLLVAAAYKQPVFQVVNRLEDAYLAASTNKCYSEDTATMCLPAMLTIYAVWDKRVC